jgi:hypothetical protein
VECDAGTVGKGPAGGGVSGAGHQEPGGLAKCLLPLVLGRPGAIGQRQYPVLSRINLAECLSLRLQVPGGTNTKFGHLLREPGLTDLAMNFHWMAVPAAGKAPYCIYHRRRPGGEPTPAAACLPACTRMWTISFVVAVMYRMQHPLLCLCTAHGESGTVL